jgi:hypothetical protein
VCTLARDFLQEQDFTERNVRQRGSKQLYKKMPMLDQLTKPTVHIEPIFPPVKLSSLRGTRSTPEHSSPWNSAPANTLEQPQWKRRIFHGSSMALEHARANSSPWNPAPGGNPGLKRTRIGAIFKSSLWKRHLNLKETYSGFLKTSNLSNENICKPFQSGETIPLSFDFQLLYVQ